MINFLKKSVLLIVLALTMFQAQAQKPGWVILKGQLKGFNNQVVIEEMSEFQYLLPPSDERLVVPDSAGNFSIRFKIDQPNYYRLGRNALYLSPGDDLKLYVDYSDPRKATFEGTGATANTYLKNTPFPKGGSFVEAGKNIKNTPEETVFLIETLAADRANELRDLQNTSPEFRRLETFRIKADIINSIKMGEFYSTYKLKLKDSAATAYTALYRKAVAPKIAAYSKDFVDPSLLKLVVYRDIADELIKDGGKPADIQVIKDYYTASEIVKGMQKVSDKKLLTGFNPQIASLKTPAYKAAVNQMHQYLMAFGKGDVAVDFTAVNLNGEKISLSSLKGKVIYVDLWATWCGPCMQEMPSFEKLKAKYAGNPNVVFVSLSIDENESLWKTSVAQRKADGEQWLINRSKLQAYNIVGIPRSLLINKDFKMVNMSAPLPSETAVIKEIDALLK